MTEENCDLGRLALEDIIESDLAVEPDAKVAEELRMLPEDKETSDNEEIKTAYAVVNMPFSEHMIDTKKRQRTQKENGALNISKQLDKQTVEIERMSSVLQSAHKYTKPLRTQPQLIKQLQSQIKQIQRQTLQVQKYVTKKKNKENTT